MLAGKRKQIQITLRFYGDLNDMLASSRRGKTFIADVQHVVKYTGRVHTVSDFSQN